MPAKPQSVWAKHINDLRTGRSPDMVDLGNLMKAHEEVPIEVVKLLAELFSSGRVNVKKAKTTLSPLDQLRADAFAAERYEHYFNLAGEEGWVRQKNINPRIADRSTWAAEQVAKEIRQQFGVRKGASTIHTWRRRHEDR